MLRISHQTGNASLGRLCDAQLSGVVQNSHTPTVHSSVQEASAGSTPPPHDDITVAIARLHRLGPSITREVIPPAKPVAG
ncbi:hypothetical protein GCM10027203_45800 [Nonomuraea fastidiosa]